MLYIRRECVIALPPAIALYLALSVNMCFGLDDNISEYMTVAELYQSCKVPAPCGKKLECEGRKVLVSGLIDWDNVFDKKTYPNLPYQKFTLHDEDSTTSIEVWADPTQENRIFDDIYQHRSRSQNRTYVEGVVTGIDLPIMGPCKRMIRIDLGRGSSVSFK